MTRAAPTAVSPPARDKAAILKARARELARVPPRQPEPAAAIDVIVFTLSDERYAIEAAYVREVDPLSNLTPLPCTPPFIAGIVNVRGQILAVIDLKRFFGLPNKGLTDAHRAIILHSGETAFGVLADTVSGVWSLALDALLPALPTLTGIREHYLKGITNDRLVVLDAVKILADPVLIVNDQAPAREP